MNSLISIIVPVYNVDKYLKSCVDSLINQTYKNIEIILVDDGSPDTCSQICDDYVVKDSRIKVIHKTNGGISSARNAGLEIASGEWIGFVDSDDYVDTRMFQTMLLACNNNQADICVCRAISETEEGEIVSSSPKNPTHKVFSGYDLLRLLTVERLPKYTIVWNKLYKKELFYNLKFEEGKIHEDEFVIHKLYDRCNGVVFIDDVLYHYRIRQGSIMHSGISLNSFDRIDALIDRIYFLINKDYMDLAIQEYLYTINAFCSLYLKFTSTKEMNTLKNRFLVELENLFSKLDKSSLSFLNRVRFYLFNHCNLIYLFLLKMKNLNI